jgi:hypothetical protein
MDVFFMKRDEICIINVTFGKEFLGNELVELIPEGTGSFMVDFESTTDGDTNGMNALIEKVDLKTWKKACRKLKVKCEVLESAPNGYYGSCNEDGVVIASVDEDDDYCFWIYIEKEEEDNSFPQEGVCPTFCKISSLSIHSFMGSQS